jgi:radical SAM superfamily enzyme YgiQ (UPF0313 family)
MPDAVDVLFLVPPSKPVFRPFDLIYPFFKHLKNGENMIPIQLGLLSMAAYLRDEGFSCQYYDLCHFKGEKTLRETVSNLLKKYNPRIIGLTSYTPNFNATLQTINIIKEIDPNVLICVGGPHVTFLDRYSIEESENKIDVVVRGEGELVMRDIAYYHLKGLSLEENVRGITTKNGKTENQKLMSSEELSSLPPMAFDLIPQNERNNTIYIPLNATRGCPFNCTFCAERIFWEHQVRFRSPEKVVDEILIAEELFPKRSMDFTDSILPVNMNHFEKLVDEVTKRINTPIKMALTRANLADNRRMQLMKSLLKDDGFVIIGVENGDPDVLALMKKPSWDVQLTALKKIKEFSLMSIPSWIIGFCGETLSSMNLNLEKIDYLNRNQLIESIILEIWIPLPGTAPFLHPKEYGAKIHTYNWDFYDRAVYPPPYSLFDVNTGEITLTSDQIWAYYLSALSLQKKWSTKKNLIKGPEIAINEFLEIVKKNPMHLYVSPAGESQITIYTDLFENFSEKLFSPA